MDHISFVVDDLPAAVRFFTTLGMAVEGESPIEGEWVDRVNGIENIQVNIVMMKTPDGHGRLELTKFRNPKLVEIEPAIAPPNIGEVVQYEDKYRLCYMRGPADIIVALAEELS
jgi:catechol 2,3-dioxygenase-like lactoylglutathione lyase family enzyme